MIVSHEHLIESDFFTTHIDESGICKYIFDGNAKIHIFVVRTGLAHLFHNGKLVIAFSDMEEAFLFIQDITDIWNKDT